MAMAPRLRLAGEILLTVTLWAAWLGLLRWAAASDGHGSGSNRSWAPPLARWLPIASSLLIVPCQVIFTRRLLALRGEADHGLPPTFAGRACLTATYLVATGLVAIVVLWVTMSPAAAQLPDIPVEVMMSRKHTAEVTRLGFAPPYGGNRAAKGQEAYRIVSTSTDGRVLAWDLATDRSVELAQIPERIGSAAFSPVAPVFSFGNHYVWGSVVRSVDLRTGKVRVVRETETPNHCNIHAIDYSSDGLLLALVSSERSVKLFHTLSPGQVKAATPTAIYATDVSFAPLAQMSPKGGVRSVRADHAFAYGCRSGVVETGVATVLAQRSGLPVISVQATEVAFPSHGGEVTRVSYSSDGSKLGSSGRDGMVLLSDARTGKGTARLAIEGGSVNCFCFDPSGMFVATASDNGMVETWSVASGRKLANLSEHPQDATWVDISADGKFLASGGRDFVIRVWRLRTATK